MVLDAGAGERAPVPVLHGGGLCPYPRPQDQSLENLRGRYTAPEIIGKLAYLYGLQPEPAPRTPDSLLPGFDWARVPKHDVRLEPGMFA